MRRPAKLERAGALTPRDRIWAAVRIFGPSLGGPWFSVAEIMVLSDQRADTVLSYLTALSKAKFVEVVADIRAAALGERCRVLRKFQLLRDVGVEAPRVDADGKPVTQGIGRDQMWRAMRVVKNFDCRALAAAASTAQHPVSIEEVKTYVRFLTRAGYLADRPGIGRIATSYSFIRSRDTGPRAPLVTRDKSVIDGNTGAVVYEPRTTNHEPRAQGGSHAD